MDKKDKVIYYMRGLRYEVKLQVGTFKRSREAGGVPVRFDEIVAHAESQTEALKTNEYRGTRFNAHWRVQYVWLLLLSRVINGSATNVKGFQTVVPDVTVFYSIISPNPCVCCCHASSTLSRRQTSYLSLHICRSL